MTQFAIRGHENRGKEVIEILEMLGGKIRRDRLAGNELLSWYYINGNGYIDYKHYSLFDDTKVFTLEEFLEKFPFKVGDKVIVKGYKQVFEILSMRWCSERNDVLHSISNEWFYTEELQPYKEQESIPPYMDYDVRTSNKETMNTNVAEVCERIVLTANKNELELIVANDSELVNEDGKWYVKRKKPNYPTTFRECCEVLSLGKDGRLYTSGYKSGLIQDFQKLIICRDAYWKIAGEEMGLGKSWEPDWKDVNETYFTIAYDGINIKLYNNTDVYTKFAFHTEEIRDAFKDNFDNDIEFCKEFL